MVSQISHRVSSYDNRVFPILFGLVQLVELGKFNKNKSGITESY